MASYIININYFINEILQNLCLCIYVCTKLEEHDT